MKNTQRVGLGTLLVALMLSEGALALQQATIGFNPEAPLSPLEQQAGELDAYRTILDRADASRHISLINRFLGDYPTSEFRHLVLRALWEVRREQGDSEGVIEAANMGLEASEHFRSAKLAFISNPSRIRGLPDFWFTMATEKAAYYHSIVEAYRDLGDFEQVIAYGELGLTAAAEAWDLYEGLAEEGTPEYQAARSQNLQIQGFILFNTLEYFENNNDVPKIIEYNERILELTPNDLQGLMTTSRLMAEEPPSDGIDPIAYRQRARGYAEDAAEQLEVFLSGPGAAGLGNEQRATLTAQVQSTLGLTRLRLEDWGEAADAFRAAIGAVPESPTFYLMLGLASRQLEEMDAFLSAYARAVYLEISQPQVRSELETIYGARNGSLEGLDEFIENEGTQILVAIEDRRIAAAIDSAERSPRRTAYIEELIENIDLLPTVFPPNRMCYPYYELLAGQDLGWAEDALEIGVGSGVNSLIVLDQGVGRLVGTDINENAVKTFEQNAAKFGYADKVDVRLVPLDQPEAFSVIGDDEKYDLIISNPPWEDNEPRRMFEYAYMDSGWTLLRSMLAGLSDHLKENGKVWLLYGDPSVIPAAVPPAVEIIMREAPEHNLNATFLYSDPRCSIVEILVNN